MIKQGMVNDSILEKKFKILRTSILLGNIRNREELMATYEDTAREIDKLKSDVYEELLASKEYTTTSLEDEQVRLSNLIDCIEHRVNERNAFVDDYIKITSSFLDDLPIITLEDQLSDYRIRLDNINEYLNNCAEIKRINSKLDNLKKDLKEKYDNKNNSEMINDKLEDELIDEFNKIISNDDYYAGLNYIDIDEELDKIERELHDKKDVMDTFVSSYEALKGAGISGSEREEYLSYVQDARLDYYTVAEKKFLLNIYKLVLDKENNYDLLYQKRLNIENILNERKQCRIELEISNKDNLEYFINLCNEQFSVIKSQKINIDNIDKLVLEIAECENRLKEIDIANNRDEIQKILDEYSLKKPKIGNVEEEISDFLQDNNKAVDNNETLVVSKAKNMVVSIHDPIKINVKNATDTAKLVMKKVVIVLEPKKFNNKKDKLKEAEKELQIEKQEKLVEEANSEVSPIVETEVSNTENFVDFDVTNETDDKNDNVFLDNDLPTLNLNTLEVDNKDVKDTISTDNVKINFPDVDEVSVPTEIFIEESPKEKVVDLFSETDPFLDDNKFEINENNNITSEIIGNMPEVKNIGTVRPNSVLSKIETFEKENNDIVLPTMGLTDSNKVDVPIVSENYIN